MLIPTVILSVVLLALAAVHMLWGFGYWFPVRDEAALVRAVVGAKGAERMPGAIPCATVTALLLILLSAIWGAPGIMRDLIVLLAAAVFLVRGILPFTKFWRRMTPTEPFATLDRKRYGPASIAIGLMLLVV